MAIDPYTAPKARVEDVQTAAVKGEFIAGGQAVAADHGWQWIVAGWGLFKRQPGTWILLVVVLLVITILIALIPILGNIAGNVLGPVFGGGILLGCRALDRGDELELGHLFAGFRDQFGKLALVGLLYLVALFVIVLVSALVAGIGVGAAFRGMGGGGDIARGAIGVSAMLLALLIGLALLVPVAMAMWFAPSLIVFNDYGVTDALTASFNGCMKNIVPFTIYGLIFVGFAIVATIPLGLGWLVLLPTLAASLYASYRDIYYAG